MWVLMWYVERALVSVNRYSGHRVRSTCNPLESLSSSDIKRNRRGPSAPLFTMMQPTRRLDWGDRQPESRLPQQDRRPPTLPPTLELPSAGSSPTPSGGTPLDALGLSKRAYNALMRAGIKTVEQLAALSRNGLACVRGVGQAAITEIETRLAAYEAGLSDLTTLPDAPLLAISIARLGLPPDVMQPLGATGLHMVGQLVDSLSDQPPVVQEAVRAYLTWLAAQPPAARAAEVMATGPSPLRHITPAAGQRSTPSSAGERSPSERNAADVDRSQTIRACPALLPDRDGEGPTFLESVIYANQVLSGRPTTERFLEEMITWAGRGYPKSVGYCQNVLDSYYIVGLIERTSYLSHQHSNLYSLLPLIEDSKLLQGHCTRSALRKLQYGQLFLSVAKQCQSFTQQEMRITLRITKDNTARHIRLFVNLGLFEKKRLKYHLSDSAWQYTGSSTVSHPTNPLCREVHELSPTWEYEGGLEALAHLYEDI